MTISLAGIELNDQLLLEGIETATDIDISTVVTLGGLSVPTTMQRTGGRRFSLLALRDGDGLKGRFLRHQIMAIKEVAAQGVAVTLIHHMGTFSVLIESTAEVIPVKKYRNPQPNNWLTGPVQLIEV